MTVFTHLETSPSEFDWVIGETASQRSVYESMCEPLIGNIFEGFNATVFAYGQTGSGKTFTMGQVNKDEVQPGIIPYAVDDIFSRKEQLESQGSKVSIQMSYMEIYMEECYDLLNPEKPSITLKEDPKLGTVCEGLTMQTVHSSTEVHELLNRTANIRATGSTAMNNVSSRSHALCTFTLRNVNTSESGKSKATVSKLNLVDLAGSERAKRTQATGDVFAEGVSINKGLLALGNVISTLAEKSKSENNHHLHIPYRDSKLTRILKDSLGGNGLTTMLACISPSDTNLEESLYTLRFGSRALNIINTASVNHDTEAMDNELLLKEILEQYLKMQLQRQRSLAITHK